MIPRALLLRAESDRKVTMGKTEWCCARVPIDHNACYFDVGFAYPGGAQAPKGAGVHRLKGIMSWVKTVVRQVV